MKINVKCLTINSNCCYNNSIIIITICIEIKLHITIGKIAVATVTYGHHVLILSLDYYE